MKNNKIIYLILFTIMNFYSCDITKISLVNPKKKHSANLWLSYFYSLNMCDIKLHEKLLKKDSYKYSAYLSNKSKSEITLNYNEEISTLDWLFKNADINMIELKEIETSSNHYKIFAHCKIELYQVPKKGYAGYFQIKSNFIIKFKIDNKFNEYITEIKEIPISSGNKNIASIGYVKSLYNKSFKLKEISKDKYHLINSENNIIILMFKHTDDNDNPTIYMNEKGEKIQNFGI